MGLLVDTVQPDLSRESHDRGAVGGGVGRPQQQVDRARTEGGRADAGTTGQAPEDFGHERRRLLVADQHVPNRRPGQSVGEVDVLLPGNAEHARDTLMLEAAHEQVGDTSMVFGHGSSVAKRRRGRTAQPPPPHRGRIRRDRRLSQPILALSPTRPEPPRRGARRPRTSWPRRRHEH